MRRWLIAGWVVAVILALALRAWFGPAGTIGLEACLYAGLILWLAGRKPLMEQARALPVSFRFLCGVLLGAALVGQLINHSQWTYPWVGGLVGAGAVPGGDVV